MGKTKDLVKKIRDTKGTFHAKMGLIKDRKGMDLTEVEDTTSGGLLECWQGPGVPLVFPVESASS